MTLDLMMRFEIRPAPSGKLTWFLVDENGAVVARSLGAYKNMKNVNRAIRSVREFAVAAPVVDTTTSSLVEAV